MFRGVKSHGLKLSCVFLRKPMTQKLHKDVHQMVFPPAKISQSALSLNVEAPRC